MKDYNGSLKKLVHILDSSQYTVLFTGSRIAHIYGVVIPNPYEVHLWERFGRYYTLDGFKNNPVSAWKHYLDIIERIFSLKDLGFYRTVKEFVDKGFIQCVLTTGVDCLYRIAGIRDLIELHGCILKICCLENKHCMYIRDILNEIPPKCCFDGSLMYPAIAFYGEELDYRLWAKAIVEIETADLVIVGGFDYWDYPSNLLPLLVKRHSGRLVVVDNNPSPLVDIADLWIDTSLDIVLSDLYTMI